MDCRAYCTATTYQLNALMDSWKERYSVKQWREFIHVKVGNGHLFCFNYGAAVFWGLPRDQEDALLGEIRAFEVGSQDFVEFDDFTYRLGEKAKIDDDEIVLPDFDDMTLTAISHGLAQSVKLAAFEVTLHKTYDQTKYIPEQLAKDGKIRLSRRQIRKHMGTIFLERAWVNLHMDVLEVPEFFWEYPEIEPYFQLVAHYLEIDNRVEVLNQRLDVVHDLFEMLGTELNHQHSSRLEWAILILIGLEVTLFLGHEIFKIL